VGGLCPRPLLRNRLIGAVHSRYYALAPAYRLMHPLKGLAPRRGAGPTAGATSARPKELR
jgi:hypothetical protein